MDRRYHNPPPREPPQWVNLAAWQIRREDERDDNARRRAGIRSHVDDPADPYSTVTWRACETGCAQHRSTP